MTAPTTPPQLYKEPALLNREQHRGLRFKPNGDASATRTMNAIFCAVGEFAEAATEFVIAFLPNVDTKDAQGRPELSPVVLLGLREAENLFVDADGRWNGRYAPAAVRRLPFGYSKTGDQLNVMIDQASPALNREEGDLLIDEQGEATEALKAVMRFLDGFESEQQRTRVLCRRLVELDLFKSVQIDITQADGAKFTAGQVFVIDEDKLRQLPDAVALELLRNGALGLLYAQVISMSNVHRMTQRLEKRLEAESNN